MGLGDLPSPAVTALADHLRLLLAWTGAVNLTAIRDPRAAVAAHVLDALAALPLLRENGVRALLDLGSGGGYPGLPLAIALPAEDRDVMVFHAGTRRDASGTLVSSGGRVLVVTALGATLAEAQRRSVAYAERVAFAGRQFRRDIGWRELAREEHGARAS